MLYLLAEYFQFEGLANLIRYQSTRAGAALFTAFAIGLIIGPRFISMLRVRQGKGQPIREDGPKSHLSKRGTPTMGGLMILIALVIAMVLWMDLGSRFVWACLAVTVGFGAIGFLDDYDKVTKRSHKGVPGRVRLLLEFIVAGIAAWIVIDPQVTGLYVPFMQNTYIPLGPVYYIFAAVVMVGAGNAVNLTDGLDGLATMPVIITAGTFAIFAYLAGPRRLCLLSRHPARAQGGRAGDPVRRDHGGGACLPVVQRAARRGVHGRYRQPRAGRRARRHRGRLAPRVPARHRRRAVRRRGGLGHHPGVLLQAHRPARVPHGADPPPLRAARLGGIDRRRPLLDRLDRARRDRPRDAEAQVIVSPAFAGKRYAVLGLARSGMAALECLLASGAQVTAWDSREEPRAAVEPRVLLADPLTIDLSGFEGVVVSPGVPLNTHPIAEAAAAAGVPIIGDIELFARARGSLPAHRVVGITGTNGKSTATALVHHLLKSAALPVRMAGNIGIPILSQAPLAAGGVYVLELSSYQIDLTRSLACEVAALLNVTPDHLNRYADFDGYAEAKARLFAMQRDDQHAVFGVGDTTTAAIADRESLRREPRFVHRVDGADLLALQPGWPALQGPHNLQNAAAAVAIVEALGLAPGQWRAAMPTFRGLPHRMERIGEYNGVLFINDSKATNAASTAPALAAFPPVPGADGRLAKRLHWIVGGLPKSDELDECRPWFENVAAAYTIGDAGPLFAELLEPHMHVTRSEMMAEAIKDAIAAAKPGDVVMLSPACASFDQFRDYEARGDVFRQIVEALAAAGSPAGGGQSWSR